MFYLLICCSVMSSCLQLHGLSMPGFPVLCYLPDLTQTHVHWVCNPIQPSYLLSSASPPALNLSHYQGLFQWVGSSHQVAKVLGLQLQHQSFQWIFRIDFLWDWLVWSPAVQGILKSLLQHHSSKESILRLALRFFMVQLTYPNMTSRKFIALTIWAFVSKAHLSTF